MLNPWASKSKMSYKTPPPTLLVSYAGRVVAELKKVGRKYSFQYLDAFQEMNLSPLPGLPMSGESSLHDELPLFFKERLPDLRRPEISSWLQAHPSVDRNDDLQLLGALGAHSITDSFVIRAA
jgi:HipA-like protein